MRCPSGLACRSFHALIALRQAQGERWCYGSFADLREPNEALTLVDPKIPLANLRQRRDTLAARKKMHRERIRVGLEKACWKRPVSGDQIDSIINAVEADIHDNYDREVPSRYIGEKVFNMLREIDQVAFVRFASVYREFKDVNDFVEELGPMLSRKK